MARNDEGEFELVLGNKQLLSLFFLVVVLFAVFFSLGYMVGKSVAPGPMLATQSQAASAAASSPAPSVVTPPPSPTAAAESAARVPEQPPAPVTETQPARSEPGREAPVKSAAPPSEPPAKAAQPAAVSPAAEVVRGLHLQIAAVRVREDANALVQSLRKKGYSVQLNEEGADGWYRVVIGPFASERAAQETKARLEEDGYKSILKRP